MNGYLLMGNAQARYRYPDRDLCYGTFQLTGLEYNVQDPETVGILVCRKPVRFPGNFME
jgi:hypothetical protein